MVSSVRSLLESLHSIRSAASLWSHSENADEHRHSDPHSEFGTAELSR